MDVHNLSSDPRLSTIYDAYAQKQDLIAEIRAVKKALAAAHDVMQMDELKCRKRVLRRLGFASASDVVEIKGRVACEISTGDELLLTEMIFNGVFNTLLPEQCAALLSCFVFTEKVGFSSYCTALADLFLERPSDQAEGGACGTAPSLARNCEAHRQGVQRV